MQLYIAAYSTAPPEDAPDGDTGVLYNNAPAPPGRRGPAPRRRGGAGLPAALPGTPHKTQAYHSHA